ncbi:MAG TPA: HEPN domain-containing protein [bacterium]|nr:HEPN domain-containing protein [bacterium]
MVDISRHIQQWRVGAEEDFSVALKLIQDKRVRHGLFLLHLAVEKVLKAHVCKQTSDIPPRIHNLVRLSEIASLELNQEQLDLLADLNSFNIEGRYPDFDLPQSSLSEAGEYVKRTEEFFQWLIHQL